CLLMCGKIKPTAKCSSSDITNAQPMKLRTRSPVVMKPLLAICLRVLARRSSDDVVRQTEVGEVHLLRCVHHLQDRSVRRLRIGLDDNALEPVTGVVLKLTE